MRCRGSGAERWGWEERERERGQENVEGSERKIMQRKRRGGERETERKEVH